MTEVENKSLPYPEWNTHPYGSKELQVSRAISYSKTCVKQPLSKRQKIGFQTQLWLNAGQKYCRMLQGEHSAILLTLIKLPFVFKIFVLSIVERPFYFVCLFCCFTSQVNSYGHCGTVSSPNHTFSWAGLNKRITSNSCTYFRL